MKNLAAIYAKFIVALAAALAVAGSLVADGKVSLADGIAIASAFVGALGVAATPNRTQPATDRPGDEGQTTVGTILILVAVILAVLFVLDRLGWL